MRKGQAFDAFKLLIAAVVAGAILVIILNILPTTPPTNEPMQIMSQGLSVVSGGGQTKISSVVVKFDTGSSYESDSVAKKAGMNLGSAIFCCSDADGDKCPGYTFDTLFFDCNAKEISVKNTVQGKILTSCPSVEGSCLIGFKPAN